MNESGGRAGAGEWGGEREWLEGKGGVGWGGGAYLMPSLISRELQGREGKGHVYVWV